MAAPYVAASSEKAIWGPVADGGRSLFPTYADLGVGIFQYELRWDLTAPTRPADPTNPDDPAYRWPSDLLYAVEEARRHRMSVSVQVQFAPPWANGGRAPLWAPADAQAYADFLEAAARRHPTVRMWQVWGEPTRADRFRPMAVEQPPGGGLRDGQRAGPVRYAQLLDAAYVRLKRLHPANLVIGGNTFTTGRISPRTFIREMRLPNGRPPRLDMYGHNPFGARRPDLRGPPLPFGYADFDDLDRLGRWVDRFLGRGRRVPIFVSEYLAPVAPSDAFNFHVSERIQASWLRSALRAGRRSSRIFTVGTFLLDEPPSHGREIRGGLLRRDGTRRPAYRAFRDS